MTAYTMAENLGEAKVEMTAGMKAALLVVLMVE